MGLSVNNYAPRRKKQSSRSLYKFYVFLSIFLVTDMLFFFFPVPFFENILALILSPFPQTTNLQQMTLKISMQKYGIYLAKWKYIVSESSGKHCEKRWNCFLRAITLFISMFSKSVSCGGVREYLHVETGRVNTIQISSNSQVLIG